MSDIAVARRYAKAIFDIAVERKLTDQIEQELAFVDETLTTSAELREWLSFQAIDVSKKKELLTSLFQQLSEPVQNLLFLLTDRHRTDEVSGIVSCYQLLNDELKGMVEATITSAFPLSEKDEQQLVETFQYITNKKIRVVKQVDSDLLGGVVVRIGDRVYDGSLQNKLARFQKELNRSKV